MSATHDVKASHDAGRSNLQKNIFGGSLGSLAFKERHFESSGSTYDIKSGSLSKCLHESFSVSSRSLVSLSATRRTLSASNLAALSDRSLALMAARPLRVHSRPDRASVNAIERFQSLTQRYYAQLTAGCAAFIRSQNDNNSTIDCENAFCARARELRGLQPLTREAAAIMSIQLAASRRTSFCSAMSLVLQSDSAVRGINNNNNNNNEVASSSDAWSYQYGVDTVSESVASSKMPIDKYTLMEPSKKRLIRMPLPRDVFYNIDDEDGNNGQCSEESSKNRNEGDPKNILLRAVFAAKPFAFLFKKMSEVVSSSCKAQDFSWQEHSDHTPCPEKDIDECIKRRRCVSADDALLNLEMSQTSPPTSERSSSTIESGDAAIADGHSPCELSLSHLTLPLMRDAVTTFLDTGDASFLLNTLHTIFASSSALGRSFLDQDGHFDVGTVGPSYNAVLSLPCVTGTEVSFSASVVNSCEIALARLEFEVMTVFMDSVDKDAGDIFLRQILIILECPLAADRICLGGLLRRAALLLTSYVSVSLPLQLQLVFYLSTYPRSCFVRLIQISQEVVAEQVHPLKRPDEGLLAVMRLLALLDAVNNKICLVHPDLFYNDAIMDKIDFKAEFRCWATSGFISDYFLHPGLYGDSLALSESSHWKESSLRPSVGLRSPSNDGTKMLKEKTSFFQFPFFLDADAKARVLRIDAVSQMSRVFEEAFVHSAWVSQAQKILHESHGGVGVGTVLRKLACPYLQLEVSREHLISDTLGQLELKRSDLKKPLKVKFVDGGEEGLDFGGVQKDFFQIIIRQLFDPSYGMFIQLDEDMHTFYFNGESLESPATFRLVGTVLGLAIYNGVVLDMRLPIVVYRMLLGHTPNLEDLVDTMPALSKGLQQLLDYPGDDVEDVFCRSFQISYKVFGQLKCTDLIPGGEDTPVTNSNRSLFVELYTKHILVDSVKTQFEAFAEGFHAVCGGPPLNLCRPAELEALVCGSPALDYEDLIRVAQYDNGFSRSHKVIRWFWEVVCAYDDSGKRELLAFVTGSDRVPLKGLASLTFVLQRNGPDSDRLPTALTCFGRLLLPEYSSKEKLAERLRTALIYGQGFGLV